MSKSQTFENDFLKLIFNGTNINGIATDGANTDLWVSLHTTPGPGELGDQSTNEISYTGYKRIAVTRNGGGGWTVNWSNVNPASPITFDEMSGGAGGTVTHFAVGTHGSAAGRVFYYGTVTPNIAVTNGVTPQLTTATIISED